MDITQTWVSIRFEDILIALSALALITSLVRERKCPDTPLSRPIVLYWIVGGISLGNALLFIFPNLSGVLFPHLAVLHFIRRIEYMVLFFVAFEAFKKKPLLLPFLWTLVGSYLLVILYGFGQKFLGFPAFLTMNEEFAKGVPLRLPATARFPSTFGGHYDLAAYLIMIIPIMGSLVFGLKKWGLKVLFILLAVLGLIMLLFTASRISFGVYLVAVSIMLFWQKKPLLIVPTIILSLLIMNFTSGASERFYKTFRVSDVVVDLSTGKPIGTLDSLSGTEATLSKDKSPAEETLPTGSEYLSLAGGLENKVNSVTYTSKNIPGATGEVATVSGSFLIQKALVYDISITTRLQGQWPKAIEAFKRNYLLGSGYSSLSVAADGDYHRMLGETGVAGAIAFLGIFAASFLLFVKRKDTLLPLERSLVIGVFAGIVGLLCNAVLIDVFEASKVAYTLWMFLGIATAILIAKKPFPIRYISFLRYLATRKVSYLCYLLIALWIVWGKTVSLYFIGDDFTWLKWAAMSKTSDIVGYFTNSHGFFYRPIPKLWYFMMFSIFWLKPFIYHVMSLVLLSGTTLMVHRMIKHLHTRNITAWLGAFAFAIISVHHENVYWISGQSSLLAGFFLAGAIVSLLEAAVQKRTAWLWQLLSYVSLLLCMLSYDGMLSAPIVLLLLGMLFRKKNLWNWTYLLFIPAYWFVRSAAGAVPLEGDYGYKLETFVVNSAGNIVGYTAAIFGGPAVVEWWNGIRIAIRSFAKELLVGVVFCAGGAVYLTWRARNFIRARKKACIWFVAYAVIFAAYIPLGNMAERYVYIPSMLFVVGLASILDTYWTQARTSGKVLLCCLLIAFGFINIRQIQKTGDDWQKASSIVDQSLRVIKKEAWPPQNLVHFYIANMPIRYGNAWVYPTGMNDAIWHMYRQNPFDITLVSSIQEGYEQSFAYGDRRVFIFEDFVLKRGFEEALPMQ